MSSNPVIGDFGTGSGRIFGRRISESPSDEGAIGTLNSHPLSPGRLRAAAKLYPDLSKLIHVTDDGAIEDDDGNRFTTVGFDPLTSSDSDPRIAGYVATDNQLLFLERTSSEAELEAARLIAEDDQRIAAEEHTRWLNSQPQHPLLMPGATCELRTSVLALEDGGAKITLDEWGAVSITLPERLLEGGGIEGMAEVDIRKTLAAHAAAVIHCARVISPLLQANSRKPLSERVPPGTPTLGGGLA
jgi:hypothetical protein